MSIFNITQQAGQCLHIGLSTDTKPSDDDGHFFFEMDTSKVYLRTGGSWIEQINSSYAPEAQGVGGT